MNLYDLNKSIVAQLPDIENFNEKIDLINEFYQVSNNQYYMLYGKEISYFTLFAEQINFNGENLETLGDNVIDCLNAFKSVKSIDYTENKDAIEIWVSDEENNITCLYFFPYDNGVVNFIGVI